MAKAKRSGQAEKPSDHQTTPAHIQDIPHEELPKDAKPEDNLTPVVIIPIEERINAEIKKYNIPRAAIQKWKDETSELATISEADKPGYKKLVAAIAYSRGKRGEIKDKYDELTEESKIITAALRKERDELIDLLFEGETPLKKRKDEIDKAEEFRKEKIEKELQEKLQGRVATLLENGMGFNGSYYAIGDTISMDVVTLKNMEDTAFQDFLCRVAKENEKIVAAKAEADRLQAEREQLQKEQRQQQEAEAKRLREEREELDRQRREMEEEKGKMKKQLAEGRRTLLGQNGFRLEPNGNMHIHLQTGDDSSGGVIVEAERIEGAPGKEWDEIYADAIKGAAEVIAENKKYLADLEEKKRQREKREEEERQAAERAKLLLKERTAELTHRYGMEFESQKSTFFVHSRYAGIASLSISLLEVTTSDAEEWIHHLKVLDVEYAAFTKANYEEKMLLEKKQAEEQRKEKEAAEAERQLKLGDAEKLWEYVKAIRAMKLPIIKDKDLRYKLSCFMSALEELESNTDAVPAKAVN